MPFNTTPRRATHQWTLFLCLAAAITACRQTDPGHEPTSPAAKQAHTADSHHGPGAPHNILTVTDGVISGSMPEGDDGFDALAAMGVRTVISVDGAMPDIDRAHARNMQYVHIPTGYDGIRPESRDQLAAALAELPRPIYVHCHHGKHRGPAAAASGAVALGKLTPDQGVEFLKRAGTSSSYPGLYSSVRNTTSFDMNRAAAIAAELPEVARVSDFVAGMSEIDRAADHLELCRAAGWQAPADHPDLVPHSEAARVESLFRQLMQTPDFDHRPPDFRTMMRDSADHAAALVSALERNDRKSADAALGALDNTCNACHKIYRNLIP